MQRIGCASCKASIFAISMLFVEDIYLLPENVSTLTKTITSKDDGILVKTSLFQDWTVPVTRKNKAEVDGILTTLYNANMQIRKEKGLNAYQKVDPSLLWYVNIIKCQRRWTFAFFMCPIASRRYHNNNETCCNSCLYQSVGQTRALFFSLHGVSSCLSLHYHTTAEYQLKCIEVKWEKACKKAKEDKAAAATTQIQQQSCFNLLEKFAQRQWSKVMANVFFLIKLRERLACCAARIQYVSNLKNKLKLDCLLRTSILWEFRDELVTLIQLTITEQSRLRQYQTTLVFTREA